MKCANTRNSGPNWRENMGAKVCVLQQAWVASHSGQTAPNLHPKYKTRENVAAEARADQEAHGVFVEMTPEPELQARRNGRASTGGILEHLWNAAAGFFDAMQPAPDAPLVLAPPEPQVPASPAAEAPPSSTELTPEREARRKALALLKTQGKLNAAQAREVLNAYVEAGIPINEHTVSPYHQSNAIGESRVLVHNPMKLIFKTDYMVDGKRVTRVVKLKNCARTAPQQASGKAEVSELPVPGGRHCELHTLAASALSKAAGWKVVPDAWLGSFKDTDGRLHLALVTEYLPGESTADWGRHMNNPDFADKMSQIRLITSLVGEDDNAAAFLNPRQLDGKTVYDPAFADFEFAFHAHVDVVHGFPTNGFGAPRDLTQSTWSSFTSLLAPEKLRPLLAPFELPGAIRVVEQRAQALQAFCTKLMENGKVK